MRPPYLRAIDPHWWAKPPYLAYTLREATGIAIVAYALVLLIGVICLALGENAYEGWLGFLASRWSLALHAMILIAMVFHVLTLFSIMAHTLPRFILGRYYVEPRLITAAGIMVAALTSLLLLLIALMISQ